LRRHYIDPATKRCRSVDPVLSCRDDQVISQCRY
jgi:hypothetical protein